MEEGEGRGEVAGDDDRRTAAVSTSLDVNCGDNSVNNKLMTCMCSSTVSDVGLAHRKSQHDANNC
jgi:hypothetical protein